MGKIQPISIKQIDTDFIFTSDCPYWKGFWDRDDCLGNIGCDPDSKSRTLRQYHQALWSKPLPDGTTLGLAFGKASDYLISDDGIRLGSDSITTGFRYKKNIDLIREVMQIVDWKPWIEERINATYTIGGTIIFPKHQNSINGHRGMNPFICDRWDLTLECIRRYYAGITAYEDNPIGWVLKTDKEFFDKFVDFRGYCDFFFLQDCVTDDYSTVKMWIPTEPFAEMYPFPKSVEEYLEWMDANLKFVHSRNKRIDDYISRCA